MKWTLITGMFVCIVGREFHSTRLLLGGGSLVAVWILYVLGFAYITS